MLTFDEEAVPPSVKVCTSRLSLVAGACATGPSCPRCPPAETENRNISKAKWKAAGILTEDPKMSRILPSGWVLQKAFDAIIRMVRHDLLMDYNSQSFLEIPLSTFIVSQESMCLLLTSVGNRYWRHPVSKAHPHIHNWTIVTPLCHGLTLHATGCLQGQPLSAPTQAGSGPYLANLIPQVIHPQVSLLLLRRFQPDLIAYNSLIDAYGKARMLADMDRVYSKLRSSGLQPDLYTYTSVITNYRMQQRFEEAVSAPRNRHPQHRAGQSECHLQCKAGMPRSSTLNQPLPNKTSFCQ